MERDATDAYDLSSFSSANKSQRRGLMILISRLTARHSLFTIALTVKFVRPHESRLLAGRASAHSPCSDSRCFLFNLRVADCACATFAASQNYSLLDCVRSFTVTAGSCLRLNGAQEVEDRGTGSNNGGMDFGFRPNGFPGLTPPPSS